MTIREEKIERYEEALFTLWADEVAVREGRDLERENAALRLDANFRVPEEVVRGGRELISRKLAARTARSVGHHAWRLVHAAALVCLFSMLAFSAAFAASPTFRANTLNLVIETFDEGTDFRFSSRTELQDITIGWLPNGFALNSEGADSNKAWRLYQNENEDLISISKEFGSRTMLSIDTEDANTKTIKINNYLAYVLVKELDIQILITQEQETSFIYIVSTGVSEDDMMKVAKNIIF